MKKSKNNNAKKMEKRKEKSLNNTKKSNKYVKKSTKTIRLTSSLFIEWLWRFRKHCHSLQPDEFCKQFSYPINIGPDI